MLGVQRPLQFQPKKSLESRSPVFESPLYFILPNLYSESNHSNTGQVVQGIPEQLAWRSNSGTILAALCFAHIQASVLFKINVTV